MKPIFNFCLCVFLCFSVFQTLMAQDWKTCTGYAQKDYGPYRVYNNKWGTSEPVCMWSNSQHNWGATSNLADGKGNVKAYAEIFRGCHYENCTNDPDLPVRLGDLTSLTGRWAHKPVTSGRFLGLWDIYSWETPEKVGKGKGHWCFMIFQNIYDRTGWCGSQADWGTNRNYRGRFYASGQYWNVVHANAGDGGFGNTGPTTVFYAEKYSNDMTIDINDIIKLCISKGWANENWYLGGIETGWEIIEGGTFETTYYDVQIGASKIPVPVTDVIVTPSKATLEVGKVLELNRTIVPLNATNKSLIWTSSDTLVATVNSVGAVKGVSPGEATITVTTVDGNKTATCSVTVEPFQPKTLVKLKFNEGTGSTISNEGALGGKFTKTAIPLWSNNCPVLASGNSSAVDFGVSAGNYVIESDNLMPGLAGLNAFTITGWVNCKSSVAGSGGNRIISWIKEGGQGVDLVYSSNGSLTLGVNQWPDASPATSSAGKITTSATANASNWVFFAVTYNGEKVSYFFGNTTSNAVPDKTMAYNRGEVGSNIGKLAIGHFNSDSQRQTRVDRVFRGLMDEIAIHNYALSLDEIVKIQDKGSKPTGVFNRNGFGSTNGPVIFRQTNDFIQVDLENAGQNCEIAIIDMAGKLVKKRLVDSSCSKIDLNDLKSGVYLVKSSANKLLQINKIVVAPN